MVKLELGKWRPVFAWTPIRFLEQTADGELLFHNQWLTTVYVAAIKTMRSPTPEVKYMTAERYKAEWIARLAGVFVAVGKNPDSDSAVGDATKYATKQNLLQDPEDFFALAFGKTPQEYWQGAVLDIIFAQFGERVGTNHPIFLNLVAMTGGYGQAVPNSEMADYVNVITDQMEAETAEGLVPKDISPEDQAKIDKLPGDEMAGEESTAEGELNGN